MLDIMMPRANYTMYQSVWLVKTQGREAWCEPVDMCADPEPPN